MLSLLLSLHALDAIATSIRKPITEERRDASRGTFGYPVVDGNGI